MPQRPRLASLLFAAAVPALTAAPALADPLAAMREGAQPGCAAVVLGPSGPRFDAVGYADLDGRVPITPETRFLIASASKQFTALAVLALADQDRIDLDAPAARYLPEMAGALQGATVRQLLNQTAGVRDHTTLMALSGVELMGAVDPQTLLAMMRGLHSGNFAPGSRARYSNGNYLMLAQLVERVTGQTLDDWARRTIFIPAGMTRTSFTTEAPMAHGYRPRRDGSFVIADDQPPLPGSGGLVTTVEDLARFDVAFRTGTGVWTSRVKAAFSAPGRLPDGSVSILPEFGTPYGAGVGLEARDGVDWLRHDGGAEGFRAEYLRQTDAPRGAAVLCNRGDVDAAAIAEALTGLTPPAEAPTTTPRPAPPAPPEPASQATLAGLTGRWVSAETGIAYDIRPAEDGVTVIIRSPLSPEPITEDWGGVHIGSGGDLVTGPLRLKVEGDTLSVSFGRRVERLIFQRRD